MSLKTGFKRLDDVDVDFDFDNTNAILKIIQSHTGGGLSCLYQQI